MYRPTFNQSINQSINQVRTLDVEYKKYKDFLYVLVYPDITQTAVIAPVSECIRLHWLL